eukprot:CAMPEP_0184741594 /NCGR_PEP_ID=MMETSP0315-20130426/4636_1 /TAXON_ID=101924 /ORGANISM="Rhodosorus marinus, Strain UTEX LB 2760" /LENGTH=139 /DNA_ID=CAMNT_0027211997 /DNA_START=174 /DNA_END=593 /DNA_ORIENTATION=+
MSFGASCRLDLPEKVDADPGCSFPRFGGINGGFLGGVTKELTSSSEESGTPSAESTTSCVESPAGDSPPVCATYLRKLEDNLREHAAQLDHPKFRMGLRRKRRNLQKHVSFSSEVTIAEPDSLPVNVTYEEEGNNPHAK